VAVLAGRWFRLRSGRGIGICMCLGGDIINHHSNDSGLSGSLGEVIRGPVL